MTKTLPEAAAAVARSHAYRADIDGLRALAVLAVVIFHAFPAALPGGFAGVDVFFVISGYLITGILLADMRAEQFSLAQFYARRIRRIFPALVTVLLATWTMGWFCLTGDEYRELGKHVLAGAGFVSNWAFWTEAGYFDQTASAKPLLHLWSLGVEEQFYIVWPVLMYVAVRLRRVALVCAVTGLLSFVSAIWLVRYHPSAAFYWPTSRMWELAAGAGLAITASGRRVVQNDNAHSASSIGLLLCAISFIVLNSRLPFPGWFAVPPVLGAVALIAAGPKGVANRLLLGNPVAVWFGKISYALYLWHWPLLSLCFVLAGGELPVGVRIGIIAVSIVLAWLTTVLIERPIRLGAPARWKLITPCILMLGVAYLGGMTYQRHGLGFRKGYSPDADVTTATLGAGHEFVDLTCGVPSADRHLFQFCATDKRATSHFAVWGDSKADALYWGLVRKSTPGMSWTLVARASCPPMAGVHEIKANAADDGEECPEANKAALRMLLGNPALTAIVLVAASRDIVGPQFAYDGSSQATISAAGDGLDNAVAVLLHAGKRVVLVLDNPELRDPRQCMDRRPLAWPFVRHLLGVSDINATQRCAISYRSYLDGTSAYRSIVDQIKAHHPDLTLYDPTSVLCDSQRNVCPMTMNGKYLYSYGDHMSDYANGLVAGQFLALLRRGP
ncbi:Peptidoglycan/LPS O-acetylase OafA/YrhL, contains acyltransferase and SGNH-hydrolase domains [Paraburkholderia phenazinium]|uniref:Peptidoglycan/LPS O-acetylase OafA/YrhL, contains acyltransferase and SGNH-hydrolase domains n=1 Tax=Paraburkholderia phenazinium TaxID=60549 RepID=A0A1G7UVW5_9BURK|nr:acyltransferase family protein [Paraburkholderia phenazinium]SDG51421.1 Peptidoglycan/LPS O-acetylase OafA/YrhL, contains acyltransferase and SGNH-hydrolase domains [Paraburkholderia phenazinium]